MAYGEGDEISPEDMPKVLWHGTSAKLEPGDEIDVGYAPTDAVGHSSARGSFGRDHVYATPSKSMAEEYAWQAVQAAKKRGNWHEPAGPGHMGYGYQVEPTGPSEVDPEYHPEGVEDIGEAMAFRSEWPYRVLNRVQF